jgi:hypothetical protein
MGTGGHNVPLILDDRDIRKLTPKEFLDFRVLIILNFPKMCLLVSYTNKQVIL